MKKTKQKQTAAQAQVMADHLKELRIRLFVCVGVVLLGGIIGYIFYQPILTWFRSPLNADLYYSSPAGSFTFIMKVASMVGIGLALPVLIYNIMMFIQPALKQRFSVARITGFTIASVFLAVAGALFAFYTILPGALKFFSGFEVTGLSALISADSYLSFVSNSLITFMIVFQIPLLMIIIDHIKPIQPKTLLSMEKYVVVAGLVVAICVPFAFDIVTCLLIAAPIIILYNVSVVMIIIQHAQRAHAKKHRPTPLMQKAELVVDDNLIAEFFAGVKEEVKTASTEPRRQFIHASRNNEFNKTKVLSADEVRRNAYEARQRELAEKVAKYQGNGMQAISDIR